MTTASFEEIAGSLQRQYGLSREDAERAAKRAVSPATAVNSLPGKGDRVLDAAELGKLEKEIEDQGDKVMRALGFEVVRFSHPGRTKQTPGIPDRRYYSRRRRLAFWWEAKAPDGEQRPDQRVFQEMCEACGEPYVLGGLGDLKAWLTAHRVAVFDARGNPIPWPEE